jgi:hypothetical protein
MVLLIGAKVIVFFLATLTLLICLPRKSNHIKTKRDCVIKIIPNPVNTQAIIVPLGFKISDGLQIEIMNAIGKKMNEDLAKNYQGNFAIDISALSNGLYFIQYKDRKRE